MKAKDPRSRQENHQQMKGNPTTDRKTVNRSKETRQNITGKPSTYYRKTVNRWKETRQQITGKPSRDERKTVPTDEKKTVNRQENRQQLKGKPSTAERKTGSRWYQNRQTMKGKTWTDERKTIERWKENRQQMKGKPSRDERRTFNGWKEPENKAMRDCGFSWSAATDLHRCWTHPHCSAPHRKKQVAQINGLGPTAKITNGFSFFSISRQVKLSGITTSQFGNTVLKTKM